MNHRTLVSIALFIVLFDQFTKFLVLRSFMLGDSVTIIPGFFNLVLAFNKGVAFGIFSGIDSDLVRYTVLGVTTLIALGAVFYFARTEGFQGRMPQTALALILGGAVGNLIDRVRLGMVTDFLDFHIGEYHWPAFNIADSAICIGVFLLLFFTPDTKRTEG